MEEDQKEASTMAANSNPSTRPNSKSSGITQDQLTKFRELQRRRLQIKSKAKTKRKPRDGKGKKCVDEDHVDEYNTVQELKDPSVCGSSSSKSDEKNEKSTVSAQVDVHPALKKKKLHWGLDTKERWERKANM